MKYKRNIIVLYSKTLNPDNWTEMDKIKKDPGLGIWI